MKKTLLIVGISLLTSQAFGMSGSEQSFNEALRIKNFDYAENIVKGFRKNNQFQKARELEFRLNEAKLQYMIATEKGTTSTQTQEKTAAHPSGEKTKIEKTTGWVQNEKGEWVQASTQTEQKAQIPTPPAPPMPGEKPKTSVRWVQNEQGEWVKMSGD